MVGNIDHGEYHLQIRNVSLADDDNYRCQLTPTDDEPKPKLSRRAKLTIIVQPKDPLLVGESIEGGFTSINKNQQLIGQFNQIAATEGHSLQVSCQSRAGRPPAQISWVLAEDWQAKRIIAHIIPTNNDTETTTVFRYQTNRVPFPSAGHSLRHSRGRRLFANITEFRDLDGDSQLYTVISHLNFSPSRDDNGHFLVCMATHEAYGKEDKTASISLDVFYPPKVIIEIEPEENGMIKESGSIRLLCRSDSRPNEDLKYTWSWDGEPKRLEILANHRVSISSLRFNDNLKNVNCTVENSVGFGSSVFQLNIPFGPRFMSTNQTKIIDRGSETTFQCEVLGNPTPIIRWYHGRDQDTPIHEGANLTVKNAQDWEEGEYRCIAEVEGFPSKTLYHQLYLKGPPKVRFIEYILSENEKDITLICEIQSRVLPVNIQWFHNGHRMDVAERIRTGGGDGNNNKNRFQVNEDKLGKHLLISKMTILDFVEQDLGLWNCSARNDYGVVWEQKDIRLLGFFDRIEIQWREMPFQLRIVLGSAFFCIFAVLFLLLLVWLIWRKCHSKMSNHSSCPNGGSISVKCEPVDGMTASESCGTPPYPLPQQYFYNNEAGGLTAEQYPPSNGNIHFTPEMLDQQQMLFEYEQQQQQVYRNGNCGYYCEDNNSTIFDQQNQINNGRRSSASTFNNNNIAVGGGVYCPSMQLSSFEYQQPNSNGLIQNGGNGYIINGSGLPRIHLQSPPQHYCGNNTSYFSSPLETLREVTSPPKSLHEDAPLIIGVDSNQNCLERSLSRNSTHV
uniref:Ig-like domain-containing protein n=1 Tax=Meloidogyne hapla TaxID=6305 RepID=A0A1I8BND4_MELHA